MIIGVAIKDKNGKVWSLPKPNRHHNVIPVIFAEPGGKELLSEHVQGFIDDTGVFLTRVDAWFEAKRCNQILPPYNPINPSERAGKVEDVPGYDDPKGRELFSEDLW
jgi:hypothetical protein